jgi:tetratricopeptide (TPR) repeat protein
MGQRFGLAAVRLRRVSQGEGSPFVPVNTPDTVHDDLAGDPLWYALLPRRGSYAVRIDRIDPKKRTFDLLFDDNRRERLSFDGFSLSVRSQLPASMRHDKRQTAYQFLRDATANEDRDRVNLAIANAASARQAAHDAGDPELESWIGIVEARMLARSDRPVETVRATIDAMLDEEDSGAELCWEVAQVYSTNGEPSEAAHWYIRALDMQSSVGHTPIDVLRGAVVSLGETGDWARADGLIDTFVETNPGQASEATALRALVKLKR